MEKVLRTYLSPGFKVGRMSTGVNWVGRAASAAYTQITRARVCLKPSGGAEGLEGSNSGKTLHLLKPLKYICRGRATCRGFLWYDLQDARAAIVEPPPCWPAHIRYHCTVG